MIKQQAARPWTGSPSGQQPLPQQPQPRGGAHPRGGAGDAGVDADEAPGSIGEHEAGEGGRGGPPAWVRRCRGRRGRSPRPCPPCAVGRGRRGGGSSSSKNGNGGGRLWQLPESSIAEYARWVLEKPEADRRPAEQRFLWKYMNRTLRGGRVGGGGTTITMTSPSERARKDAIELLEAKPESERSAMEGELLRRFHERKTARGGEQRKRQQQQQQQQTHQSTGTDDTTSFSWCRVNDGRRDDRKDDSFAAAAASTTSTSTTGNRHVTSLASLRESMKLLGLSTEELTHQGMSQMEQDE